MRVITAALALALLLAGCGPTVTGQPVPEPRKLDCDLIFPGPGGA